MLCRSCGIAGHWSRPHTFQPLSAVALSGWNVGSAGPFYDISCIGDLIISIEHVGSTSVEGLASKPIIDIDVVIDSYDILPDVIKRLDTIGFEHEGNLGVEGREAFKRRFIDEYMPYHLYVCPKDGKGHVDHIAFRNYLRKNYDVAQAYGQLKMQLAERFRYDIDNYCKAKSEFCIEILSRAHNSEHN